MAAATTWIISNGHISSMTRSIHLYSAHRGVIFAIAQPSCMDLHSLGKRCVRVGFIAQVRANCCPVARCGTAASIITSALPATETDHRQKQRHFTCSYVTQQ